MSDKYLVILRGLIRGKRHWGHYLDEFQDTLPDFKIISFDIPGNGTRYKEKSFTNMHDNILDLRAKLKEIVQENDEVHICALSLGGMIAMDWIQHFPEDFKSAILVNTSFNKVSPLFSRLQFKALLTFLKIGMHKDPYKREKIIYSLVSNSEPKEDLIKYWAQLESENPVSAANAIRQIFAGMKFSPQNTTKLPIPTYVLSGKGDRLCSSRCSQDTAKKWSLKLDQHPTGGHELQNDDPEWFFSKVKTWLYEQ